MGFINFIDYGLQWAYCVIVFFGSLIWRYIKYVQRLNGTAQWRFHATARMANFFIEGSKEKVTQVGKDLVINHMWSKKYFSNVTLTGPKFHWAELPLAENVPVSSIYSRLQWAWWCSLFSCWFVIILNMLNQLMEQRRDAATKMANLLSKWVKQK